ncbi:hypothetical protein JTB14_012753 [Gonioctena quinquepunctata]|nr:hypothetical protein JTB14_012753 [Gonioctena quinquepunctata]
MAPRVWANSDDGTIMYISLTAEYLEGALDVLKKSFYVYEAVCRAVRIQGNDAAISELDKLTLDVIKDGVSVIAVEKSTNTVCGVAFNKLQVRNDPEAGTYFANYAKSCKHSSARSLVLFMSDADAHCDLFEQCDVDCLLEIMFISTLPNFMKKRIATKLCEVSTELAKRLLNGENVKQSVDGEVLKLEPVPKLVAALFTSPISQRIGKCLDWQIAAIVSYDEFFHEGQTFSSVLGDAIPYTTVEYKTIQENFMSLEEKKLGLGEKELLRFTEKSTDLMKK